MKKENDLRRIFDDEDWEYIKRLAVDLIEEKFRRLSKSEREAVLKFLESL